jgi:hypothetical protein
VGFWGVVNLFERALKDFVEDNLCAALSLLDGDVSDLGTVSEQNLDFAFVSSIDNSSICGQLFF